MLCQRTNKLDGVELFQTDTADCNAAQDFWFTSLWFKIKRHTCQIRLVSGRQHSVFVHTSKLWGSGLYGSHASLHSVAHPLEGKKNSKHQSGPNLSSYFIASPMNCDRWTVVEQGQLTEGAFRKPFTAWNIPPPIAPMVKAPPQSSTILHGLKFISHS